MNDFQPILIVDLYVWPGCAGGNFAVVFDGYAIGFEVEGEDDAGEGCWLGEFVEGAGVAVDGEGPRVARAGARGDGARQQRVGGHHRARRLRELFHAAAPGKHFQQRRGGV